MRGANDNRTVRMKVKMTDATAEAVAQRPDICRCCPSVMWRRNCIDALLPRAEAMAGNDRATVGRCMRIDQ
ncbi:hypothetical protein ATY45_11085 [Xanthomonas oryzae pv. oryzae]|nr:hypothetical protein ATY45_11085 [Xanthomonas oryzae pv. oryzae]